MKQPTGPLPHPQASAAWSLVLHGEPALQPPPAAAAPPLALSALDAALLARVALDGTLTRQRLAAWLWADAPPSQALANLRQRLYRLGRRLGGQPLLDGGGRLRLASAIALAEPPRPDGPAAALGHGLPQFLGSAAYADRPAVQAWAASQRRRWQAQQIAWLQQAIEERAQTGRFSDAAALLESALASHPLDEVLHRRLMQLHADQGDAAAVAHCFERCRAALLREQGGAPSAATLALRDAAAHAAARLPGPPAVAGSICSAINALSAQALALLRLGSVAGSRLTLPWAERATGQVALQLATPWQELQAQGWFDDSGPIQSLRLQSVRQALPSPLIKHLESLQAPAQSPPTCTGGRHAPATPARPVSRPGHAAVTAAGPQSSHGPPQGSADAPP